MKWVIFRAFIYLFPLFFFFNAQSQDLFDLKSSTKFANYLFETKNFELATREYQRVVFMQPLDTSSWLNLAKSYQYREKYDYSLSTLDSAEKALGRGIKELGMLKAYAYLKTDNFIRLENSLVDYDYENDELDVLHSSSNALSGNWSYFDKIEAPNSYWMKNFKSMAVEIQQDKRKSPFLAGLLSTAFPGSGKAYVGRWKDGLFSLLLVGANSWQAIRLINKKGIKNVGSIFFSGFSVGLYLGNIYGSVKAAKGYNQRLKVKNDEKANELVDLYFGY